MRRKIWGGVLGVLGLVVLGGCATTRSASETSQLQVKVAQLERQLESRDQEIKELKGEIQTLSSSGQDSEFDEYGGAVDEPKVKRSSVPAMASGVITDTDLIRVDASAQQVQTALKNAGYYDGVIDGKLGRRSKSAIESFQKDHGLKNDGVIGRKTWAELSQYLK